jgi:hypothetical protein
MNVLPLAGTSGFYAELTRRNAGVIGPADQEVLASATVLVAGCGSIGGAAVEPLARLGVQHLVLADPGEYELNNLNRQNATMADLGRNKAEVAAERVRAINPAARVTVFGDGVTAGTVAELTGACDAIVDGVDVTTAAGLRAKFLLHQHAHRLRLPLVTGWDMAGAQYARCYDYRIVRRVFDGQLSAADLDRLGMWQLLKRMVPLRYVPLEMVQLAGGNLSNREFSFPQLVYAADLFGAIAAHVVAQLLTGQPVRKHIYVDLYQQVRPAAPRWSARIRRPLLMASALAKLMKVS